MAGVSPLFDRNTMVLQGVSALLLQFLHPGVARELARTGAMERDPFGRLRQTGSLTAAVLRRDPEAIRRFRKIHDRLDRGQILWVFATLVVTAVESRVLLYGSLDPEEAEALYSSARILAVDVGIPDELTPPTYAALEAYYLSMIAALGSPDGELHETVEAVKIARAIFSMKVKGIPLGWLIKALAAGLSPDTVYHVYQLEWSRRNRALWWVIVASLKRRRTT